MSSQAAATAAPSSSLPISLLDPSQSNPRGIPALRFLDDTALEQCSIAVCDDALVELQELHSRFKTLEAQAQGIRARMKGKIPDMESALEMVKHLRSTTTKMRTRFMVADSVFAEAEVERDAESGRVCLWLGANVMMEYTFDEAEELLERNLSQARIKFTEAGEDARFLKEQITIAEVSIARFYNYGFKLRKAQDAIAAAAPKVAASQEAAQ